MKDLRQDKYYATYLRKIGWTVDKAASEYLYSIKLPLIRLSVTKIQRPETTVPLADITKVAKKRKSFIVYIEPKNNKQQEYYNSKGFRKSATPSLPTKTIQIDLSKSKKDLSAKMHHKTRYNSKLSKRKGVKVSFSRDISKFTHLWIKEAKRRGMFMSQKREIEAIYSSFGQRSQILFARKDNDLLGGILLLFSHKTAYYMYAFSNDSGKKMFAPTLLVWESILYAKKSGMRIFDFEGVYDGRYPLKTWKGFTRFKKSFGGEEIEHPGPLKKYFFPLKFGI